MHTQEARTRTLRDKTPPFKRRKTPPFKRRKGERLDEIHKPWGEKAVLSVWFPALCSFHNAQLRGVEYSHFPFNEWQLMLQGSPLPLKREVNVNMWLEGTVHQHKYTLHGSRNYSVSSTFWSWMTQCLQFRFWTRSTWTCLWPCASLFHSLGLLFLICTRCWIRLRSLKSLWSGPSLTSSPTTLPWLTLLQPIASLLTLDQAKLFISEPLHGFH